MNYIIMFTFIILFILIIIGFTTKPSLKPINILPKGISPSRICIREKTTCSSDNDCFLKCSESSDGEEMVCRSLPDIDGITERQKTLLNGGNEPQKYCIPLKATMDCSISTGGIPVFSGWSGGETDSFECICSYPLWASSRNCDPKTGECSGYCLLNPDICKGGIFDWDLTQNPRAPLASLCTCREGDTMVVDMSGLPRCVPSENSNFYTDLDILGDNGFQPLVQVGLKPKNTGKSETCVNGTKCIDNSCCPLKNGVCCGDGTCCPIGYTCDPKNNRCLREDCSQGTKCGDGSCCPIKGGICSPDNKYCCPPSFPHADVEKGVCNPNSKPLLNGNCLNGNMTQCVSGCCPYTDGVCCGNNTCCPSEYPVCDTTNNICKRK